MALRNQSMFLYGLQVTGSNCFISFVSDSGARLAQLNVGFYSLSTLSTEIERAMTASDPTQSFTVTADRTVMGGLENRLTITTGSTVFELLFETGNPSNPCDLIGFLRQDYTGATTYTGSATCGITVIPEYVGYSYLPPTVMKKNFGKLNVSASGIKESITFSLQQFWQVQFKFIAEDDLEPIWEPLIEWMIQQRELEFTPDVTNPDAFFSGTLEDPSTGLEMSLTEQLPDFPFNYQTAILKFRVSQT